MSVKIVDNFPEFIAEMMLAMDIRPATDVLERHIKEPIYETAKRIINKAPVNDGAEEEIGIERPSIRLWKQVLSQSFKRPDLTFTPSGRFIPSGMQATRDCTAGVIADFPFNHPSVNSGRTDILDWVSDGTEPHLVPANEKRYIKFWWGAPLRWGPQEGDEDIGNSVGDNTGFRPGFVVNGGMGSFGHSTFVRGYWASGVGDFISAGAKSCDGRMRDGLEKASLVVRERVLIKSKYLDRIGFK